MTGESPQSGVQPPGDEAAFIARLKTGDAVAFERLVRETSGRMLAVAKRILQNDEDAQDAVQQSFLLAFRALRNFEGQAKLSTWLHRITVNTCLMKLRSRRKWPESRIDDLMPRFRGNGHHESMPELWNPPPSAGIERQEILREVREAILELPEDYRDVILLRDLGQVDTRAAAEMLKISESAVKTRLHRARMALRAMLDAKMARQGKITTVLKTMWMRHGPAQGSEPPARSGEGGAGPVGPGASHGGGS